MQTNGIASKHEANRKLVDGLLKARCLGPL